MKGLGTATSSGCRARPGISACVRNRSHMRSEDEIDFPPKDHRRACGQDDKASASHFKRTIRTRKRQADAIRAKVDAGSGRVHAALHGCIEHGVISPWLINDSSYPCIDCRHRCRCVGTVVQPRSRWSCSIGSGPSNPKWKRS